MLVDGLNFLSKHIDPESVHKIAMGALKIRKPKQLLTCEEVQGQYLKWKNSVGLAAGFDKNGEYLNELADLGFGALELGTVTPRPQLGSERPRIKKIHEKNSILNWMGFPSLGCEKVFENLQKYKKNVPLGVNIGKNKETPDSKAIDDYLQVAIKLKEFASYNVINVSSPNTAKLRTLQNRAFLSELTQEFARNNIKNVMVKLAPDLEEEDLFDIVDLANESDTIAGIIATNTTVQHRYTKGGVSGELLKEISYDFIKRVVSYSERRNFDLVACGGISSASDIERYKSMGIDFFQIYSSFVYQGPEILKELVQLN